MIHIRLNIIDSDIKEEDIIESFFKVSSTEDMKTLIAGGNVHNVKDVVTNMLEATLDIEVPDGNTLYVTGSYATVAGGLSYTSSVVPIVSGDTLDIEIDNYFPQRVKPPVISTGYPKDSHSYKGFVATIDKLDILLNKQYASTWVLVRLIDNIIVESYIEDTVNLYSKRFDNELLPGIYALKVRRHMISGDASVYSVYTFTVKSNVVIFEKHKLNIDKSKTLYVNGEVKNFFVNADDANVEVRVHKQNVKDVVLTTSAKGLIVVEGTETNAVIQVSLIGKPESSVYLYSKYKYAGNCKFDYTLPIEFC